MGKINSIVGKTVSAVLSYDSFWREPFCIEFTDGSKLWLEVNADEGHSGHLECDLWLPKKAVDKKEV
jgi:hypothetical protein